MTNTSEEQGKGAKTTAKADSSTPRAPERSHGRSLAAESLLFVAIIGAILVAVNVIGVFFPVRADMTETDLFSLSDGSRDLVNNLDAEVEVVAYFTADLPPPFNATERYVRDLLSEYEAASSGKMRIRFVNPDTEEETQKAEEDGVRRVSHQAIENDAVQVREGYRGLVFRYLGERKTIPVVQDTAGLEYTVTQTIKELVGDKTAIGVLSGHGGPSLSKGLTTLKKMLPTYDITSVDADEAIDPDLQTLLVVSPEEEIPEAKLKRIDTFLMNGGSLGIFGGTMKVNLEGAEPSAEAVDTGLNRLLKSWGIQLGSDIVADAQCGRVPMRTAIGLAIPVPYPPAPIVAFKEQQREHPALFRLNQLPMFFTSHIETKKQFKKLGGTVLATSSDAPRSWLMKGDDISLRVRDPREWTMTGEEGPFALMVAVHGRLPSAFAEEAAMSKDGSDGGSAAPAKATKDVRVMVVGTGSVLRDEFLPQPDQADEARMLGSMAFALNAVDWLSQDADLIAIRAKTIEEPALEVPQSVIDAEKEARESAEAGDEGETDEALARRRQALEGWELKKATYRWANTLGLPILLGLFGVVRWRLRKRKKETLSLDAIRA